MKHLAPALFGLMLSGGLITASAVVVPTHLQTQHAIAIQTEKLAPVSIDLDRLAHVLIGMMYFGLPCSCLLAVLLHHQRVTQQRLAARLVPIRIKSRY